MQKDYVILGAGPAGLQVGYFLSANGFSYHIYEACDGVGTTFRHYPVNRTLISINKRFTGNTDPEYNLRHDWNSLLSEDGPLFTNYSKKLFPNADDLVFYLKEWEEHHSLNISYNHRAENVIREGSNFLVTFENSQTVRAKRVIIATGLPEPNTPNILGIELAEQYKDISTVLDDYNNQRVLIIGKGNSSFETANMISGSAALVHLCSPESVRMAWNTHYVGDLRAVNNNILDMYQLKSQHAVLDANIKELSHCADGTIRVTFHYQHAQDEVETIHYDRVICCAGFKMDKSIFTSSCSVKTEYNDKYPSLTSAFESTNQPGLYFAGTLTHSLDYRKATSGFIHGFRYNADALVNILAHRYHNQNLRHKTLSNNIEALEKHLLERINRVSSLWQQPGFLADFYVSEEGGVKWYDALPLEYGFYEAFRKKAAISLTFEYGHDLKGDIFRQERIARDNLKEAYASKFLHPVLRCHKNGKFFDEHHIIEDLEAIWTKEELGNGVKDFFKNICSK